MIDTTKKLWYISQINLFRELPEKVLKKIAEISRMRDYTKGEFISTPHDDESGERVYLLKEGEVQIYETVSGKKIVVDILEPGDIFGYSALGDQPQEDKKFIRASKDAVVCIMPRRDFMVLLETKPDLALRIIQELSVKLSHAEGRLREAALSDIENRLFQELEYLSKRYAREEEGGHRTFTRKFTHETLANIVGTSRETITRALARLEAKKKIRVAKDGRIIIL